MSKNFSKIPYLAFVLSAFMLVSCGKDDDDVTNPNDPNNPANQKCVVTGESWTDGTNEYVAEYVVDAQRKVTRINAKDENGNNDDYSTVEYNGAGQISKINHFEADGTSDGYATYEYNGDGLLVKRNEFYSINQGGPNVLQSIYTYEYNGSKQLVKRSYFDPAAPTVIERYNVYSRPAANKVIRQSHDNTSGTPVLSSTEEYTLDDKKSPQLILGVLFDDEFVSTNNPLSITEGSYTETNAYQYNSEGFPIQVTSTDGSGTTVQKYTYNCQ